MYMIELSIKIAIISIFYLCVLPKEAPFNKWYLWGYKNLNNTWFYKPIFVCEKCFAGQFSLWYYLLFHVEHLQKLSFRFVSYSLFEHIYFVSLTVIITAVFAAVFQKIQELHR